MPELGIHCHSLGNRVGSLFVPSGVFVTLTVVVVNKPCHKDLERGAMNGVINSSVTFPVKSIEIDRTIEIPDGQGRLASLPGSLDGGISAVLVIVLRNPHLGFDSVDCLLQHGALYGGDIVMQAMSSADDTCKVDNNPVVTGSRVIGELEMI
jgi:hypothetical protein